MASNEAVYYKTSYGNLLMNILQKQKFTKQYCCIYLYSVSFSCSMCIPDLGHFERLWASYRKWKVITDQNPIQSLIIYRACDLNRYHSIGMLFYFHSVRLTFLFPCFANKQLLFHWPSPSCLFKTIERSIRGKYLQRMCWYMYQQLICLLHCGIPLPSDVLREWFKRIILYQNFRHNCSISFQQVCHYCLWSSTQRLANKNLYVPERVHIFAATEERSKKFRR